VTELAWEFVSSKVYPKRMKSWTNLIIAKLAYHSGRFVDDNHPTVDVDWA